MLLLVFCASGQQTTKDKLKAAELKAIKEIKQKLKTLKINIKTKLKGKAKQLAIEEFHRLNLTHSEIVAGTKIFANNKWVDKAEDYILRPYFIAFIWIIAGEVVLCTLLFVWLGGCCCFTKCSWYRGEGEEDEKGEVYVNYAVY